MGTPHINAEKGDIAKVVLMPGDPKRAKLIADQFLRDVREVSDVRGIICYTGRSPLGKRISVMASGMGQPSIGIYSYELFKFYDVELIIRVGTCGSYQENINFFDILIGQQIMTDSNYGAQLGYDCFYEPKADPSIVEEAKELLNIKDFPYHAGKVFAADVFYDFDKNIWKEYAARGAMAVEMESFALYINASYLGKKALTLLTVTDHFLKEGRLTPEQRQTGLINMIDIAIELAEKYA